MIKGYKDLNSASEAVRMITGKTWYTEAVETEEFDKLILDIWRDIYWWWRWRCCYRTWNKLLFCGQRLKTVFETSSKLLTVESSSVRFC